MMKYLSETYGDRATNGDKSLLDMLRDEATRLEVLMVSIRIFMYSICYRKTKRKKRRISNRKKRRMIEAN